MANAYLVVPFRARTSNYTPAGMGKRSNELTSFLKLVMPLAEKKRIMDRTMRQAAIDPVTVTMRNTLRRRVGSSIGTSLRKTKTPIIAILFCQSISTWWWSGVGLNSLSSNRTEIQCSGHFLLLYVLHEKTAGRVNETRPFVFVMFVR